MGHPPNNIDLDQAKLDPGSVFGAPEDVLASNLSVEDQRAILRRWEVDADALLRATDEGMMPERQRSPGELLRAVQEALLKLGPDTASA